MAAVPVTAEIAQRAAALGLTVHKPVSLRKEPESIAALRALAPDALVVVAYGQILPPEARPAIAAELSPP